jgi:hypothetical protein
MNDDDEGYYITRSYREASGCKKKGTEHMWEKKEKRHGKK